MNKRQRKKNQKKQDMFISSFCFSYKEVKQLDRMFHEYEVAVRKQNPNYIWDMDFDELEALVGSIPDEYGERSKIVHEDVFKDGVPRLTTEQFTKLYCNNCGTQRCEGIKSEWFDGCKFKDHLSR